MRSLLLAALCAAAAAIAGLESKALAADDAYPSRPITMVVPLGAGGSTDLIARVVAEGMRVVIGVPIIVENTTGAGGTIGVTRLQRSPPDGYTIGIGQPGTNVATGAIYPIKFDLLNDFEPIGLITNQPFLIVTRKTLPADNLVELIAWLKANAANVSEGTSGTGTPSHIAGVMFQQALGTKWTFVPYRGAGQSMQDLIAGNTDLQFDAPATSMGHVRSGLIKAFAVTHPTRISAAPDIPTTDEAGLPGFYFPFWHALWAPKGTPKPVIAKLNAALVKALDEPAMRAKLKELAHEVFPREQQTPEALYAFHKAEIEKWWPIVKAAGVKAE
jgi:tripartite-type tricarboxylate transporter receptor subunit TctC